jgi:serine phosphatase RsbU (regulator of sigma subunit)
MDAPEFGEALRALHDLGPSDVIDSLAHLNRRSGALDVVAYLADFAQTTLVPIPDRGVHVDLPVGQPVQGTPAGQAFTHRTLISTSIDEGVRVWAPIIEGSECTGVLALTLTGGLDNEIRRRCEELGLMAGAAIALAARSTDLFNLIRRRKSMSLPASLQWDLLPPLRITTPEAASTGLIEPAYEVGGDSFDHAVTGFTFDVAIMDAMGHGLDSSIVSSLATGSYRHDRREGQPLGIIHERLDAVLASRFEGKAFVTGQLSRLDLRTGELSWVNAGHPMPLLVRGGRVAGLLSCQPSLPWGLGGRLLEQAVEHLRPGDAVVFYTDGVIDGRSPDGESFGLDRLVNSIEQTASSRIGSEISLRTAIEGVLAFQDHHLRDDATIVWLDWHPGAAFQV